MHGKENVEIGGMTIGIKEDSKEREVRKGGSKKNKNTRKKERK